MSGSDLGCPESHWAIVWRSSFCIANAYIFNNHLQELLPWLRKQTLRKAGRGTCPCFRPSLGNIPDPTTCCHSSLFEKVGAALPLHQPLLLQVMSVSALPATAQGSFPHHTQGETEAQVSQWACLVMCIQHCSGCCGSKRQSQKIGFFWI